MQGFRITRSFRFLLSRHGIMQKNNIFHSVCSVKRPMLYFIKKHSQVLFMQTFCTSRLQLSGDMMKRTAIKNLQKNNLLGVKLFIRKHILFYPLFEPNHIIQDLIWEISGQPGQVHNELGRSFQDGCTCTLTSRDLVKMYN